MPPLVRGRHAKKSVLILKFFRRYQHEWWCMKVTCGIVTLVPEQIDCSINKCFFKYSYSSCQCKKNRKLLKVKLNDGSFLIKSIKLDDCE